MLVEFYAREILAQLETETEMDQSSENSPPVQAAG